LGLDTGNEGQVGTTKLYLVRVEAYEDAMWLDWPPLPPEWLTVNGQAVIDSGEVDNDPDSYFYGCGWGETLVASPAGAKPTLNVVPTQVYDGWWKVKVNAQSQEVKLQIIDANTGSNLTDQTSTVIVGQQMNLRCQLSVTNALLGTLQNFQWTVPGYVISNYLVALDSSSAVVVTNFPTGNSNLLFHWVDGANSRTIQCSATALGKTITGQATFNVLKPSADLLGFTNSSVVSIDADYAYLLGTALHFGTDAQLAGQTNWGMRFYVTNIVLNGCSSDAVFFLVQAGTTEAEHNFTNSTSSRYSGSGLDTRYPAFPPSSATLPWWSEDDPPGESADGSAQVWRSDHFVMYLLYQLNAAGSIPVPLKRLDWSWSGTAQTNGIGGWQLLSASVAMQNVNVSADYPVWTNNTLTGTTITNNQWINPFP
jgi:hypothetical protein